jgi:HD-GYP domain-containing protein (c-di-GMP phosphodiesterase class II)
LNPTDYSPPGHNPRKQRRSATRSPNGHHEKLNGKGYPFGLNSERIPVQAKMMTICDIFDALSASDRPCKRAVPTDRALDILKLCVRDDEIDPELFRVFLDAQVYRLAGKQA